MHHSCAAHNVCQGSGTCALAARLPQCTSQENMSPGTSGVEVLDSHEHLVMQPGPVAALELSPCGSFALGLCGYSISLCVNLLGVGVISHQSVRIHINAGRRWFWENTHQRGNYTSELAKHHVDAGFRSTQQIGQSAGFVVDAVVYSTFGGISR